MTIGSGPQWTSWHETAVTPGFIWGSDADDTFYTINGGGQQVAGVSYSPDYTSVTYDFGSSLPVGTVILLHSELQYMDTATFDNNANPIVVNQFAAVPEPSVFALLGLGVVFLVTSRRRE